MSTARYLVHYQIATYSGAVEVEVDANAERDVVIATAERRLARVAGPLPAWGARSYRLELLSATGAQTCSWERNDE